MKKIVCAFVFLSFMSLSARSQKALLEPEDGYVYHGVQTMTYETGNPLAPYLDALNDSVIQPAVRGFFMSIPGTRGPDKSLIGLKDFFDSAQQIGFIPELSLFFVSATDTATDSIIAVSTQYDWIIDSVISLFKNYSKKMFLRIGGEFNGKGEGWNGGGYHPYYYVTMFQKIVNMYAARGHRDSIATNWCYEPDAANDFDSIDSRGALWYPGDAYVDWFGLDVFDANHFDQSLPNFDRGMITEKGKSELFLEMARSKRKPVFLSEVSAKGTDISSDPTDGINDWNNWFAKFWAFISVHKEIKGFGYINANWPASAYAGWGNARIGDNTYITEAYKKEMHLPQYIHLKKYSSTGLPEMPSNSVLEKVVAFPNPCNQMLYFTKELEKIKVFDMGFKLVLQQDFSSKGISTVSLANGLYFLQSGNGIIHFIVQH